VTGWISIVTLCICAAPAVHADKQPDESVLGTIEANGSSASTYNPPKLAVIPLPGNGDVDETARKVIRHDLDLVGLYDVVEDKKMPDGPFAKDTTFEAKTWQAKGIAVVVRVFATPQTGGKNEVSVEAWLTNKGNDTVFTQKKDATASDVRLVAHGLTDALLGALTGRTGGFASKLAYTVNVGKARQVFTADADGENSKAYSPATDTALSPAFGPNDEIYYSVSHDFAPFQLVHGPKATPLPIDPKGSVLGVAFDSSRSKLAIALMSEEKTKIFVGNADGTKLAAMKTEALANRPAFGPLGKMAYVGNTRIYVDGTAVSPAGFHASAPVFCDTPQGLLIVFTVGVGSGADIVATDTTGGSLRRLTQGQGSNAYPACSPDGRMIAFVSTGKSAKGPGMYILPIVAPWRLQRISTDVGESLAWSR